MARKEKKYHYIYKTTNIITGKYYYGMHSTDYLEDGYLGSGRRLRYSINKYGESNHKKEILEFFENRKNLIEREKEIVNLNEIAKEKCMNIVIGGEGGFFSEEYQKKRSIIGGKTYSQILKTNPIAFKKHSENSSKTLKRTHKEGKIKYGISFKGKKHTEESKLKMSKAKKGMYKGKNNPQYGTCWITKNGINKLIKKIYLNNYIKQGWIKGRILKNDQT